MTNPVDKQSFGQAGATIYTDAAVATGDFCAVQLLTDTNFTAMSWSKLTGTFPTDTLTAGTVLYGPITGFTIGTGDVIAYHQSK